MKLPHLILASVLSASLVLATPAGALEPADPPPANTTTTDTTTVPVDDGRFTVASFNVLGDSHTRTAAQRRRLGKASSAVRTPYAVKALRRSSVDVVGLQEFQPVQHDQFQAATKNRWDIFPTTGARANAVAWRKAEFTMVSAETVLIPYFGGREKPMPVVRLKSKRTGSELFVTSFHLPASLKSLPRNQRHFRMDGIRRQVALVLRLRAETGLPVVITGTMNEKLRYFCMITANGTVKAAAGGRNADGTCTAPRRRYGVDWLVGTTDVKFPAYQVLRSPVVRRATNHPLVIADVVLPPPPVVEEPAPVEPATPVEEPVDDGLFTVASFNVLGDSHTRPGGDRDNGTYEQSAARTTYAVQALNRRGVDVVGLQEFEPIQHDQFRAYTQDRWGIFPTSGFRSNAVAWRTSEFSLVSAETIPIPYFREDKERPMPVVRLQSKRTGAEFYVASFHLPASLKRFTVDMQPRRDEGTRRQVALVERLKAETGLPVIITGDMNERLRYFCAITANGMVHAAAGGSHVDGSCTAPENPYKIDWVVGTKDVAFSEYAMLRTPLVQKATDHPLVASDVLLPPVEQPAD